MLQVLRAQYPLVHVPFTGHVEEFEQGIASQRCAALHAVNGVVHGFCAEQAGAHAPLVHTPTAQSASVAHFAQA
ncbi:MAG TPA: hypothetical protein VGM29_03255 [Polyangiaceae bacterium]